MAPKQAECGVVRTGSDRRTLPTDSLGGAPKAVRELFTARERELHSYRLEGLCQPPLPLLSFLQADCAAGARCLLALASLPKLWARAGLCNRRRGPCPSAAQMFII